MNRYVLLVLIAVAAALAAPAAQAEYTWVVSADLGNLDDAESAIYSGQGGLAAPGDYWNNWFQMCGVSTQPGREGPPKDSLGSATDVRGYGYAGGAGAWGDLGGTNSLLNSDGAYDAGTLESHSTVIITLGPDAQATDLYDVAAYIAIPGYAAMTYGFGLGEFGVIPANTQSATTVLNDGGATLVEGQNYVVFRDIAPVWANAGDIAIGGEGYLPRTYEGYYLALTVVDDNPGVNSHFAGFQIAKVVPEPGTFALAAMGLLGLLAYGWRRRK